MLTVIDEYTRECLAIHVQGSLKHDDVLAVLTDLFTRHGPPEYIRSDNGSEFTAIAFALEAGAYKTHPTLRNNCRVRRIGS